MIVKMEILLSFSQEREDIILYHLLKKVTAPIRYIDVGANDPLSYSVTKFFYDRGASGINIEPQRKHIEQLNKDRPKDINLAVGISNKPGELTLYGDNMLASFDRNNEHATAQKIACTVPVVTLSEVFSKYVSKGEDVHFLKVDVEGWERECLEGMDFLQFRPWILCIESTLPCTTIPCHKDWEELVLGQNYTFLGNSDINRYYAAAERLCELQEFRQPQELDAIYSIISFEDCHGYWFDKYLSGKSILRRGRKMMGSLLDQTSLGRKVKTSLQASFIWRKISARS